jgi:hypothetical protein
MRPDAQIVLALLAVAVLATVLWIFWKARRNGGVAELPSFLMFGWGGAAWGQTCIVIDRDTWKRGALIAHERCHQRQMARDGTLTFYWRYFTSKQARQEYEVEAYRVWVQHEPGDVYLCANWLVNSYGLKIGLPAAMQLLKSDV